MVESVTSLSKRNDAEECPLAHEVTLRQAWERALPRGCPARHPNHVPSAYVNCSLCRLAWTQARTRALIYVKPVRLGSEKSVATR